MISILRFAVVAIWSVLFAVSYYALKRLMDGMPEFSFSSKIVGYFLRSRWFYVAGFIYPFSVLLSSCSLRIMPVSTAGPVFFILGTVITILLGIFFFSETVSFIKGMGLGFCLLGVIMILVK
jgi:multidrug transporter EmrE-like cation transporter